MKTLNKNSTDADLVENLRSTDPVYDTTLYNPDTPAKRLAVKKCALCGAVGKHNQENVTHKNWCPWIWAIG